MECLFFGIIGGMLYQVGVYAYKRLTTKPVDTNKMVIDTALNAMQRNKATFRKIISSVR